MTALAALFLATFPAVASLPQIEIDSCVDVDAEQVRRLADIELQAAPGVSSGELDVVVSCREGTQELRLTNRVSQRVTVRGIDLSASGARDRDARARELALAIAELFRRSSEEPAPEIPPQKPSAPQVVEPAIPVPPPERLPWRAQLGATAAVDAWTGGEALFGADLAGRVHLSPWLIGEVRLGGRKTRSLELESGTLDAYGLSGAAGLSLDATPHAERAGVAFGARLGLSMLRYSALADSGDRVGVANAAAVSAAATVSGFIAISRQIGLLVDASLGSALHKVVIREDSRSISALNGVLLSSALGITAQF